MLRFYHPAANMARMSKRDAALIAVGEDQLRRSMIRDRIGLPRKPRPALPTTGRGASWTATRGRGERAPRAGRVEPDQS